MHSYSFKMKNEARWMPKNMMMMMMYNIQKER